MTKQEKRNVRKSGKISTDQCCCLATRSFSPGSVRKFFSCFSVKSLCIILPPADLSQYTDKYAMMQLMKQITYVCFGTCGAEVTQKEYDNGKRKCRNKTCSEFRKAFEPIRCACGPNCAQKRDYQELY